MAHSSQLLHAQLSPIRCCHHRRRAGGKLGGDHRIAGGRTRGSAGSPQLSAAQGLRRIRLSRVAGCARRFAPRLAVDAGAVRRRARGRSHTLVSRQPCSGSSSDSRRAQHSALCPRRTALGSRRGCRRRCSRRLRGVRSGGRRPIPVANLGGRAHGQVRVGCRRPLVAIRG